MVSNSLVYTLPMKWSDIDLGNLYPLDHLDDIRSNFYLAIIVYDEKRYMHT